MCGRPLVIPTAFDYVRAESADQVLDVLAEHGDDAKVLAGGHSLLPLMKLRLAAPAVLVDAGRCPELAYVRDEGDHLAIGALTRHRDVETSTRVRADAPLLAAAAHEVGDPQVRHRGTLGGALAHGDPASDLPAVMLALDATLVASSRRGVREIKADDFFVGFLETALAPDELLVEIRLPKSTDAGWSFQKFNRRAQDWAIVGVACLHQPDRGGTRIGLVNMESRPVRAVAAERSAAQGSGAADAAARASDGLEPPDDLNGSADFRRHLAQVLVRRALVEAGAG
jgi:carbon-monoxide dehydrogenase medium subunit